MKYIHILAVNEAILAGGGGGGGGSGDGKSEESSEGGGGGVVAQHIVGITRTHADASDQRSLCNSPQHTATLCDTLQHSAFLAMHGHRHGRVRGTNDALARRVHSVASFWMIGPPLLPQLRESLGDL